MARKCPNCQRQVSGHPNKKFCGPKCKDRYHNRVNPRGYYSPRNREYDIHVFDVEEGMIG